MAPIIRRKVNNDIVRDQVVEGASDPAVYYAGCRNATLERVTIKDSDRGFRFHDCTDLTMSECDAQGVKSDGIYITRATGMRMTNNRIGAVSGKEADCCQFAYEGSDANISSNLVLRGNLFLQNSDSSSAKGALVIARANRYLVENCYIGGKNFSFSSFGEDATVRSCIMTHARASKYSFGYGVGDTVAHARHHVYDNLIEDAVRGISLSGYSDGGGALREAMDIHDNIIHACDVAFFADRPWTGCFRRNILMACKRPMSLIGNGEKTFGGICENYLNDGSFRSKAPPQLHLTSVGGATVTAGFWSEEPDELRYIWRDKGQDIANANGANFDPKAGMELSCVVLARKDSNWMLAIAETPHRDDIPRAYTEGMLPWQQRYLTI